MKNLSFLIIENDLMFGHVLLNIIVDLFRDCQFQADATDILGVPGKLLENQPDVVIYGHDGDVRGIGVLQKIKARHPNVMTVLEGVLEIDDDARSKVDYFWKFPNHQDFKEAVEEFMRKRESIV